VKKLKTWRVRRDFEYSGTVNEGTIIAYGQDDTGCFGQRTSVTKEHYRNLLRCFRGRTVKVGTCRENPPPRSLGRWLQENVIRRAIASYVAPILIHERHAERVEKDETSIRFHSRRRGR